MDRTLYKLNSRTLFSLRVVRKISGYVEHIIKVVSEYFMTSAVYVVVVCKEILPYQNNKYILRSIALLALRLQILMVGIPFRRMPQ
jgi:hypothetical protein